MKQEREENRESGKTRAEERTAENSRRETPIAPPTGTAAEPTTPPKAVPKTRSQEAHATPPKAVPKTWSQEAHVTPPTGSFSQGAGEVSRASYLHRYNHLIEEIDNLYHAFARGFAMSDSAMNLLYTVRDRGGSCPIRTVCRVLGMPKQTLNSTLRRMESEGLLTLMSDGGREKKIHLTAAGEALTERTVARVMAAENAVFSAWDSAEAAQYFTLTERYLTDLSREAERLGILKKPISREPGKGDSV